MNKYDKLYLKVLFLFIVLLLGCQKKEKKHLGNPQKLINLIVKGDKNSADELDKILPKNFFLRIGNVYLEKKIIIARIYKNDWPYFKGDRAYVGLTAKYPRTSVTPFTIQKRITKDSIRGTRYEVIITWEHGSPLFMDVEKKEEFSTVSSKPLVFWNAVLKRGTTYQYDSPGILVVGEGKILAAIRQIPSVKTLKDVKELINRRRTIPDWIKKEAQYIDLKGKFLVPGWADAWIEPDEIQGFTDLLSSGVTTISIPFNQKECLELRSLFNDKPRLGPRVFCPAHIDMSKISKSDPYMFKNWLGSKKPLVVIDGEIQPEGIEQFCNYPSTPITCAGRQTVDRVLMEIRRGLRLGWGLDFLLLEFFGEMPWDSKTIDVVSKEQGQIMKNVFSRWARYRFLGVTGLFRIHKLIAKKYGEQEAKKVDNQLIPWLKIIREKLVFLVIGSGSKAGELGFWHDFNLLFKSKSHHVFDAVGINMMWAFGLKGQGSYIGQGGPADFLIYDQDPFDKTKMTVPRPIHVYRAGFKIR